VPTVIAVSAALVLGAIGIIIGLLAKLNSPAPTSAPPTPTTFPGPTASENQSSQPSSVSTPPTASMPPPLVTGPDQSGSHASCDQGYQLPNAAGFGTQAGRGSPETSCYFAHSVLVAYWNTYGNASTASRTISAPGYVACATVPGAKCDPKNTNNFLMQCAGDGSNPWIKCTGGKDAIVYLW
jgi:serine/threonine-protein kinase